MHNFGAVIKKEGTSSQNILFLKRKVDSSWVGIGIILGAGVEKSIHSVDPLPICVFYPYQCWQ